MPARGKDTPGCIRVGIGGWTYAPWRETFYPAGTPHSGELAYASRQVTAIEINGTFYRLQKPAVYAKWREETPQGFVFSLKAPRFIVQRRELAAAGPGIERFLASGLTELKDKLGPLLWQLPPTKPFEARDLDAFLTLLPKSVGKWPLRHVLEVRHASFASSEFLALAHRHGVAVACVDDALHPLIADATAEFSYLRLRRCAAQVATGYRPAQLKQWARRAQCLAQGQASDLPLLEKQTPTRRGREVFVFFINGAKERAPAAAAALVAELRTRH